MGVVVDVLATAAVLAVPILAVILARTRRALARSLLNCNELVAALRSIQSDAATPTEISDETTAPIDLPRE